jgi:hypothetical protein
MATDLLRTSMAVMVSNWYHPVLGLTVVVNRAQVYPRTANWLWKRAIAACR